MMRRPPSSTLFPYPPLSRSGAEGVCLVHRLRPPQVEALQRAGEGEGDQETEKREHRRLERADGLRRRRAGAREHRSEEHTSELQSPCNLVCRLLLEKKKQYQ